MIYVKNMVQKCQKECNKIFFENKEIELKEKI